MNRTLLVALVAILLLVVNPAEAGLFHKKAAKNEVLSGHPPMVTTNGVVVPTWAARRLEQAPGPLYGQSWGRRPWAMPVSQVYTGPASRYARAGVYGFGLGVTPGFTNGPPLGNYPQASVGPGDGFVRSRPNYFAPTYPFSTTFPAIERRTRKDEVGYRFFLGRPLFFGVVSVSSSVAGVVLASVADFAVAVDAALMTMSSLVMSTP